MALTRSLSSRRRSPSELVAATWLACVPVAGAAQPASLPPAASVAVPVEIVGATVLLPVRINGSAPLWLLLDTGANSCVLDHALARRLGLESIRAGEATGAGTGTVPYLSYRPEDVAFEVGGTAFRCEHTISLDLAAVPGIVGHPVDGILGSDFIAQRTLQINYDAAVVRLHDPASFAYEGGGEILPLEFERRLPYVRAEITVAGVPPEVSRLLVDSGSEDAVDDPLLLRSTAGLETVTGGVGLGEEYQVSLGQLERFRLGRFEFTGVPSVAPGVALIGGEILRRFRVIADYARQRLILEPGAHLDDPFPRDVSGLDLRLEAPRLAVHSVRAGWPGAEAGVRDGDLLLAIDGASVAELGLLRARRLLSVSGSTYALSLERGGRPLEVTIRLR